MDFFGDHGVVRIGTYNGGTHKQSQPLEKGDIVQDRRRRGAGDSEGVGGVNGE
jgi:hypothetical protein